MFRKLSVIWFKTTLLKLILLVQHDSLILRLEIEAKKLIM